MLGVGEGLGLPLAPMLFLALLRWEKGVTLVGVVFFDRLVDEVYGSYRFN